MEQLPQSNISPALFVAYHVSSYVDSFLLAVPTVKHVRFKLLLNAMHFIYNGDSLKLQGEVALMA